MEHIINKLPKYQPKIAFISAMVLVGSVAPVTGAPTGDCDLLPNGTFGYFITSFTNNDTRTCTIDDKTWTFKPLDAFPGSFFDAGVFNPGNGLEPRDQIGFIENNGSYEILLDATLGAATEYLNGTGSFNYTLATNQPANFSLDTATLSTSYVNGGTTASAQKSSTTFVTDPITNSATSPSDQTTDFVDGTKSASITDSWTVTAASSSSIQTLTNAFTQSVVPVPAPLPLIGAAIAFGYSRKLRSRISLVSR
jgi:hypothetical protein